MDSAEIARKIAKLHQLRNVRFHQTGSRASATQRKLEAVYAELIAAGVTDEQIGEARS
jgi:hypothetical protein